MDIILLQNVEQLGKEGDVIQVKPGFARNYLLPLRLALPATPENLRARKEQQQQAQRKQARIRQQAEALKQKLESLSLTVTLTLGEKDAVFGSITVHDLLEALAKEDIKLDRHALQLSEPIKALGIYEVPVRLHPEVTATLKVWVVTS